MAFSRFRKKQRAVLIFLLASLAIPSPALADDCCNTPCNTACCRWCCPCFKWCSEGPPKIKFKCACGKPVCVPDCSTPNWGYFQTCWRPWPWPADYSHCACPNPAAAAAPCGPGCSVSGMSTMPVGEPIPPPQSVGPTAHYQGL